MEASQGSAAAAYYGYYPDPSQHYSAGGGSRLKVLAA